MSNEATAHDETEDRYYTQVDAGDVRLFTLDQLDAAFNAGLIHENTYVCLEGDVTWRTLAEVAGLGDEEPASAPRVVAAPASYQSELPQAPYSVAPMVMPQSLAPVASDLRFDDDDLALAALRPKRRAGKVVAGIAVLSLAGLGFATVRSGGLRLPQLKLDDGVARATAANLSLATLKDTPSPAAQPQALTPPPSAPQPETPAAVGEAEQSAGAAAPSAEASKGDSADKAGADRFSEEMKAALLKKDQERSATLKHKKAARSLATRRPSKGKSASGFRSSGSSYDPLNGKL